MQKDVFDYIEEEGEQKPPDRSALVWNILTILVLLTIVCVGLVFITVLINPQVGFNPFPPPTMPVRAALNTPTPTPKSILPPTWTPTASLVPTMTNTPAPADTPLPTLEEQVVVDDGQDDQVILGDMPVVLHDGSPQYIPATSFHPDLGCNWMGVAGQVIDLNGSPVQGLIVEVGGTLGGERIGNPTILQATGLATAYGDAGYEVKLADEPVESNGSLWVQVLDQAGLPLSEKIYFYTFSDCDQNLIVIYFKQVR
ncbi:MAG: hypothetical protein MUO62_10120 [Anaerolineales bacterium]|nr:hypothetical protein [Anaerolineales bacterium]